MQVLQMFRVIKINVCVMSESGWMGINIHQETRIQVIS